MHTAIVSYLLKDVQKKMLQARNFTKNKLSDKYFHNKLQKIIRTIILENVTRRTLSIVALIVSVFLTW